jgi:NAD(P)-dependent dehydrogenase (short-subunit alcohol dehydrogenase family)
MFELKDAVAFITGGANGIGRGIAHAMARAGARVAIADIDDTAIEEALRELRALDAAAAGVRLDVRDSAAWHEAVSSVEAQMGPIDVLCNNAGVAGLPDQPIEQLPLEAWRWILDINLNGVFNGVRAVLPGLKSRGRGGHIVNTASMAGLTASGSFIDYCASKFAVVGFSWSLREQLTPAGIGVSVLCPAFVRTALMAHSARLRPSPSADWSDAETVALPFEAGMDPELVGQLVIEGIRCNRANILTHPADLSRWEAGNSTVSEDRDWATRMLPSLSLT